MKKKVRKKPEEILKEFQIILALEEQVGKVYRQVSQDCDDHMVKRMLEDISNAEVVHAAVAMKLVKIAEGLVDSHGR